ncbi:MAG: hypothetical protein U0163_02675 [Gemmatimonadaceae bacterium]
MRDVGLEDGQRDRGRPRAAPERQDVAHPRELQRRLRLAPARMKHALQLIGAYPAYADQWPSVGKSDIA